MADSIKRILEVAAGRADAAEIHATDTERLPLSFRRGKLEEATISRETSIALTVIKDGRVGFAAGNAPELADRLVDNALATCQFGEKATFAFPSPGPARSVAVFDRAAADWTPEAMAAVGSRAVKRLAEARPGAEQRAGLWRVTQTTRLLNTSGLDVSVTGTNVGFMAGLDISTGQSLMRFVFDGESTVRLADLDSDRIVASVLRQAEWGKRDATIAGGEMPCIVLPDAFANMLVPLVVAINGRSLAEKATTLADKIGQRLIDERISLVDDPTEDYRIGSRAYDAEGVPTRRNVVFDNGVFRGFLHDTRTATACGTQTTGNAVRDRAGTPVPGPHRLVLRPGSDTLDQLIRRMGDGLIISSTAGGGVGNTRAGEFSLGIMRAFRVENGQVTGWVSRAMVAGNIYDFLNRVEAIGSELEQIDVMTRVHRMDTGNVFVPPILFRSLPVVAG
ncbi:MAG: TldD/PmbA family protein [Chloroflexota bacterium]